MKRRSGVVYSDSDDAGEAPEAISMKRVKVSETHAAGLRASRCPDAGEYSGAIIHFIRTGKSSVFHSSAAAVAAAQDAVYNDAVGILGCANFQKIGNRHLNQIYLLLDKIYFKNHLSTLLERESRVLTFRLSSRMTQRAGQLYTDKDSPRRHELSISSFLMFEAFGANPCNQTRSVAVNGITCRNRTECLLRVMEHELVHLLFCCNSITKGLDLLRSNGEYRESFHGPTFQLAVNRFFGHTDWQHTLATRDEIAFVQRGIEVGSAVSFAHEGQTLHGKVNRVQKRVTVLVMDNNNAAAKLFSDGNKYFKYYVPIAECIKI